MARAKYDPLKSNRSSFGKRPKLTWSDKRSGDSVGKGLKRGTYEAWTAYHSLPKKSSKPVKSTHFRSSSRPKSSGRVLITRTTRLPEPSFSDSDLARLRKLSEILGEPVEAKPATGKVEELEEVPKSNAVAGSEVLAPEVLQELRGEASPRDDTAPETTPEVHSELFNNDRPRNTDHCPYCGFVFPKVPKRGRACEKCGQKFVVRSNCVFYNSNFLTLEESAANDCYNSLSYSINHSDKLAKRLLSENPSLAPGELFMQMIETNSSTCCHSVYDNTAEQESWLYRTVAKYEETCGRKTSELYKRAIAMSKAKAKEQKATNKMLDDIHTGKIDIWK